MSLSGDFNPLYADVEHARRGHYGGLVVPASLIAAVVAGLGSMDVPLPDTVALVGWTWQFKAPVRPGDTVLSRWRLNRKRDVEDARWGLVSWQIEVENQRNEVVAVGEVVRLVARREVDALEEPEPGEVSRSGRRRRRRRSGGNGGRPEVVAVQLARESGAPEPPVETPPPPQPSQPDLVPAGPAAEPGPGPSRRRRRRRGNGNGSGGGPQGGDAPPAPAEIAAAPAPAASAPWSPPAQLVSPPPTPEPPQASPEAQPPKPRRPRRRRGAPTPPESAPDL